MAHICCNIHESIDVFPGACFVWRCTPLDATITTLMQDNCRPDARVARGSVTVTCLIDRVIPLSFFNSSQHHALSLNHTSHISHIHPFPSYHPRAMHAPKPLLAAFQNTDRHTLSPLTSQLPTVRPISIFISCFFKTNYRPLNV